MSNKKVYLNVASSTYVLRDFINLDNHIFISFLSYKWLVKWFLSPKRLTFFNSYYEAAKKLYYLNMIAENHYHLKTILLTISYVLIFWSMFTLKNAVISLKIIIEFLKLGELYI